MASHEMNHLSIKTKGTKTIGLLIAAVLATAGLTGLSATTVTQPASATTSPPHHSVRDGDRWSKRHLK